MIILMEKKPLIGKLMQMIDKHKIARNKKIIKIIKSIKVKNQM